MKTHGLTTWVMRTSSASSPIPLVAMTSIRMPSSAASHVTATTAFPWMPVVATSISMTVVPFGTLVGSPARLSLTATSAVMA